MLHAQHHPTLTTSTRRPRLASSQLHRIFLGGAADSPTLSHYHHAFEIGMAPKASTQKSLSFRAQSKPRSTFSASAKDQLKAKSGLKSSSTPTKPAASTLRKPSPTTLAPKEDESDAGREDLDVDDPRWDAIWRKTKKTMNVPPSKSVHIDHENRIQQILRVFDLDPNFGPCMGMSRLERWQRAKDLDLEPPQEIYDILTKKQGAQEHKENVFTAHGL